MRPTLLPALAGAILALSISAPARADEPFRDLTFDAGLAAAKKEKKLLLVDFYATWCGPCKMMDRTTWSDAKVREWVAKATVAIKVQGDKERVLSSKYRVTGFPTVILLRGDGTETGRVVGYRGAEEFLPLARAAAAGKEAAAFLHEQKLPSGKPDPSARLRAAVEYAQTGRLEESEAELRWCVEHGAEADPGFAATIPQAISFMARLGQARSSAREYIQGLSDSLGADLVVGKGDSRTAQVYAAANDALGDAAKTLATYDAVAAQGDARREVRAALYPHCFRKLYEAGRYADIVRDAGDSARLGETILKRYRDAVGPEPPKPGDPQAGAALAYREQVLYEASMVYEALLGSGKEADARRLAEQLLDFAPTGEHYGLFLQRAVKAGNVGEAERVRDRGTQLLPPGELGALQNAAATIPSPKTAG